MRENWNRKGTFEMGYINEKSKFMKNITYIKVNKYIVSMINK